MPPTPNSRSSTSLPASVEVLARELLELRERAKEDREASARDREALLRRWQEERDLVARSYVTKDTFAPVQRLVYGMTGLALTAVVTGILALVIHKGAI